MGRAGGSSLFAWVVSSLDIGQAYTSPRLIPLVLSLAAALAAVGWLAFWQHNRARQFDLRRRRALRRAREESVLRERVRESEEKFRFLLESIEDYASFMLRPDGRICSWNTGAQRMLGYAEGEVLDRHVSLFYTPEARMARQVEAVLRQAGVEGRWREEGWRVRSDGARIWTEVTTRALYDDAGAILGFAKVIHDLTERRRAEESLRILAEVGTTLSTSLDYREVLAGVARLMVPVLADWAVVDMLEDGQAERVEVAVADPAQEELARSYRRFAPDLREAKAPTARVLRTGEPELISDVTPEYLAATTRSAEHARLAMELRMRSLIVVPLMARGQILGSLALIMAESGRRYSPRDLLVARDIARRAAVAVDNVRLLESAREARGEAERRAREEGALRRATAAIGAAFTIDAMVHQIAQSALTATNADGALVERVDRRTGQISVVAVAGSRVLPLGAQMAYEGSLAQTVIERGEPEIISRLKEARERISPDLFGSCADCASLAVPLIDADETIGALILLREPGRTEFRPHEVERARTFADLAALAFRKVFLLEEAERRRIELQEVLESRSRLMRGFSHDVKNPLNAADGFMQLLQEGILGELGVRQKVGVDRARRAVAEAIRLIDELLDFAREETGEISIERHPVELPTTVRDLVEEYRAQAEMKAISLRTELPVEHPVFESDAMRIRQILGNLLTNAIKYTPEGVVLVRVATDNSIGAPAAGRWSLVSITDSGPGLTPAEQEVLFQEFRRLNTAAGTSGAGIGLASSRRIARALGGEITVASEPGRGATFTLWLPLTEEGRDYE